MFKGNYNFFDYKYNITGYNGQDFGSIAQYVYLIISFVLMIVLLFKVKKLKNEQVSKIIKYISVFLIIFYIIKTTWESIYDIKYTGSFNNGLLPLDTCSIIMFAGIIASFGKGKIKALAICWLTTGSIVGGLGTMVSLTAFKYYPFFSFGAFYSMIWHFLMVFVGLLIIVTKYIDFNYKCVIKGFIFHVMFSLIVIPLDYIYNFDFMFYKELSSIPIFSDIGANLINHNYGFLNPIIMLILYFLAFNLVYLIYLLIRKMVLLFNNR